MLDSSRFSALPVRLIGIGVLVAASFGCAGSGTAGSVAPAPTELEALSATLVLTGANVVALDPSPHIRRDHTIVADGDRIVWVGRSEDVPPTGDATVVDVAGGFVISGLSDMHAHLPAEDDAPFGLQSYLDLQLAAGVTSVRSMRGDPSHAAVRDAIAEHRRAGPDLMLASVPVAVETLSPPEAERAAGAALDGGAAFIKLLGVGDVDSYRNLMRAAAAAGLPVAGHLPRSVDAQLAVELGQQSIEHLGGVLDAVRSQDGTAPSVARALAQPSLFHCPTLHWYALGLGVYSPADFSDRVALKAVPAATRETWDAALAERRAKVGAPQDGRVLAPLAERLEALRLLHESGALLVVGPDSGGAYGLPGSAVHDEMRLFADAGLPAAEILRAATMHPAALRGATDEGEVAVGHVANLAVLAADPLAEIGNVATVQLTVHRGRVAWRRDTSVTE